jgi:hypothetical protein
MPTNNRVFYAIQGLGMAPYGSTSYSGLHGVQSVGIDTTFNLEQVFELGQLELYENIEGIPDVEVTVQKVLDGYPLLYHMATPGAAGATLVARTASERCMVALNIYPDTQEVASGVPLSSVQMSGMYINSLTYTLNVEGNSTEDVTLVGNDKVWDITAPFDFQPTIYDGNNDAPIGNGGVQRREDVLMGSGATYCVLPTDIPGIDVEGYNQLAGDSYSAHIQTVTVAATLGRTELFELGRRGPYYRFVDFPIEVTTAIEVTTSEGDQVDALADPPGGTNLSNETITLRMREGTVISLGNNNKLASITYGGGDTGGGNVVVTYNYSNFNNLTVTHPRDPAGQ